MGLSGRACFSKSIKKTDELIYSFQLRRKTDIFWKKTLIIKSHLSFQKKSVFCY